MMRPNKVFYAVAAFAATLIGALVLLAAAAVARWRERRAWKRVHSW